MSAAYVVGYQGVLMSELRGVHIALSPVTGGPLGRAPRDGRYVPLDSKRTTRS